jgi:hypothetical protein
VFWLLWLPGAWCCGFVSELRHVKGGVRVLGKGQLKLVYSYRTTLA